MPESFASTMTREKLNKPGIEMPWESPGSPLSAIGKPKPAEQQVSQPPKQGIENGSYVRIEPDNMIAWLYLLPPAEGEEKFSKDDIMGFLRKNGVVRGFHNSNIAAIVKKEVYNREIKVALGKEAVEGIDGYYEYKFAPTVHKAPAVREDGSVDYTSMSTLQNVHKGDVVAIYHHAVQGEVGYNIRGAETRTKPAKELPPLRGKGISHEPDSDIYIAVQEGKIEIKDNKIDIKNTHEVHDDVDLITGKIEFFGDIEISGNVSAGVMIRAGRNIVIKGTVESANLFAGGDIVLERGIQGGKKAKVSARGSVFADFIEHAEVSAKGDICANIILNSKLSAEGKVKATGKKGVIMGGYVHGLMGIEAGVLGNDAEIKTNVHAGYEPEVYEKYIGMAAKEEAAQAELKTTVDTMSELLRKKRLRAASMTEGEEKRLAELNKKKDECFAVLDDINQEKEILSGQIEKGKDAKVITEGDVHRGVIVGVADSKYIVERDTSFMQYEYLNGMVEGTVRVL